jgi:hypothetical protein
VIRTGAPCWSIESACPGYQRLRSAPSTRLRDRAPTRRHVRIWKTETYKGAKVTTYKVRWQTGGTKRWKKPFRAKVQAASFEAELRSAASRGEAFDLTTGQPVSWGRVGDNLSWYDFCVSYVDMKWKDSSAHHRANIAWALVTVMPAMLATDRGKPDGLAMRTALRQWDSTPSSVVTAQTVTP